MVLGIVGAYGQWKQARLIWGAKSARSVSIRWTLTFLFMFLAYLVQGIHADSAVMAVQGGLRALFYLPIVMGIIAFEYGSIQRKDLLFFAVLLAGIVAMIFSEWKGAFFQAFGYLGVIMACDQPWQIWKNKSRGRVSMTMLVTFTLAVAFWMWYAWIFDDVRLFWLSLSFCVVYLFTIALWRKYRHGQ
ncbi:MAG: hypothetical protein V1763_00865 [Parcubacteria group bacterium]